jgi:hypothetical protein
LAPEQYGSRKLHDAIHVATNKCLTFDITHQKKAPMVLASNDAVSCYDLIMHTAASLAMQGRGVPELVVVCMFTTIKKMEHIIWTIFGDSTVSYGGELWIVPPQGVLQGNRASSSIWAVVSTLIIEMLHQRGFGTFFRAAISKDKTLNFVAYTFVDDTNLPQMVRVRVDMAQDVTAALQQALDTWEGSI